MNDYAKPSDKLLEQLKARDLENFRLRVFRSLLQAHRKRDLVAIEDRAMQLSALARYIRIRGQAGQALVEAALVLPFFILLFVAVLDLGIGILDRQIIQAAAAEAARYGTIAADPRISLEQVQAEAVARSAGLILGRDPAAAVIATGMTRGDLLTVSISIAEDWIFFSSGTIRARSSARYQ